MSIDLSGFMEGHEGVKLGKMGPVICRFYTEKKKLK